MEVTPVRRHRARSGIPLGIVRQRRQAVLPLEDHPSTRPHRWYVVVHGWPTCTSPHHTPEFWLRVERAMPDYDRRKTWLAEAIRTRGRLLTTRFPGVRLKLLIHLSRAIEYNSDFAQFSGTFLPSL